MTVLCLVRKFWAYNKFEILLLFSKQQPLASIQIRWTRSRSIYIIHYPI